MANHPGKVVVNMSREKFGREALASHGSVRGNGDLFRDLAAL